MMGPYYNKERNKKQILHLPSLQILLVQTLSLFLAHSFAQ